MRPQIVCERDDSVPAPFWSDAERGSDEERRSLLAELPDWVDVPADADVPTLREMLREIDDDDPRISDDDNEGSDSDV